MLPCDTINGVYGSLTGVQQTIGFQYSVALDEDISPAVFMADVLPALEVALNDAIVPTVFGLGLCAQQLQEGGETEDDEVLIVASGDVIGLSSRPVDDVEPSVPCAGEFCYGIEGTVTIYLMPPPEGGEGDDQPAATAADDVVRQALRRAMEQETIDAPDGVRELTYVADGPSSVLPSTLHGNDGERDNRSRTIRAVIGGAIVGGVILAVLLTVGGANYLKRRRAEQGEFPTVDNDVGGIGEVASTIIPEAEDGGDYNMEDESDGPVGVGTVSSDSGQDIVTMDSGENYDSAIVNATTVVTGTATRNNPGIFS